jgi:hypothetical protein
LLDETTLWPCLVPNFFPKFHYKKGDFPLNQNIGKYMEY